MFSTKPLVIYIFKWLYFVLNKKLLSTKLSLKIIHNIKISFFVIDFIDFETLAF